MRIGIVTPHPFILNSGVSQHIVSYKNAIEQRGHQAKIIAPRLDGKGSNQKDLMLFGQCSKIPLGRSYFYLSLIPASQESLVKRSLKEARFDLLHLHDPWIPFSSIQLLRWASLPAIATFHEDHRIGISSRIASTAILPAGEYLQNRIDILVGVSKTARQSIEQFTSKRIHVIPNGIDIKRFNPDIPPLAQYEDGNINILFLGRLDKRKGVKYLIEAYAQLTRRFDNIRLIIAGDGERRKSLQGQVRQLGLSEEDVKFHGYVDDHDVPSLYNSCSIFCSPAFEGESFGIVLIEAMACGKPVVAASNKGYKDILKGKGREFLVPRKDPSALTNALATLITNTVLRKEMELWSLKEAQKYSWDRIVPRYLELYSTLIAQPSSKVTSHHISKNSAKRLAIIRQWTDKQLKKAKGKATTLWLKIGVMLGAIMLGGLFVAHAIKKKPKKHP